MSIKVIDADGINKYYQTTGQGTVGSPFQSVVPSSAISYAENEILKTYGDTVSVWEKGKRLIKFGANKDVDLVQEAVIQAPDDDSILTSNVITHVTSSGAYTGTVAVEGFTISGGELTFVSQTSNVVDTTLVTLGTPLARVTRMYNNGTTDYTTQISAVNSTNTAKYCVIEGSLGQNQSLKAQTSISKDDYYIMYQMSGGIVATSANVIFSFQTKEVGKVWRTQRQFVASGVSFTEVPLSPPIIVPKNHDIRIVAISDTNNTSVVAEFSGYLAGIVV